MLQCVMLDSFQYFTVSLLSYFDCLIKIECKCEIPSLLQVILILTKLYDFHIGSVTESTLWR